MRPLRAALQLAELLPGHRHRDAEARPRARRERRRRGLRRGRCAGSRRRSCRPGCAAALGDEALRDRLRQVLHDRLREALHRVVAELRAPAARPRAGPCRRWSSASSRAPAPAAARASAARPPARAPRSRPRPGRGRRSTRSGWSMRFGGRVPGVELDRVHLRRRDQRLGACRPRAAPRGPARAPGRARAGRACCVSGCFWKNSSPVMPSGARTSDTGRSIRCGRIRSATLS